MLRCCSRFCILISWRRAENSDKRVYRSQLSAVAVSPGGGVSGRASIHAEKSAKAFCFHSGWPGSSGSAVFAGAGGSSVFEEVNSRLKAFHFFFSVIVFLFQCPWGLRYSGQRRPFK